MSTFRSKPKGRSVRVVKRTTSYPAAYNWMKKQDDNNKMEIWQQDGFYVVVKF